MTDPFRSSEKSFQFRWQEFEPQFLTQEEQKGFLQEASAVLSDMLKITVNR